MVKILLFKKVDINSGKSGAGFTLIEILVVISLLIILAGLGLFMSMDNFRGFTFRNERNSIISVLEKARSQSISNVCIGTGCTDGKAHGVYFGTPGQYLIFQGANYASRDASVDEVITANAVISYGLGSAQEIDFSQLSGNVATPGSVKISDATGHSANISINGSGRIDW